MKRRTLLKGLTAAAGAAVLPNSAPSARTHGQFPVSELRPLVDAGELTLVFASDRQRKYNPYNARTAKTPRLRLLPRTKHSVVEVINWVRRNEILFSLSGGGHSFEGLSQSGNLSIDLSAMRSVVLDRAAATVTVGGGARLLDVYEVIGPAGFGLSAGTCVFVGAAGLTLGGGYGLFSRAWGLTCDQLRSIDIALADGRSVTADRGRHRDLFWASRGGGGGAFGVATSLTFQLEPVDEVRTIAVDWILSRADAVRILRAWQDWAPNAPDHITCLMRIERSRGGRTALRCRGQSIGSASQIEREISNLTRAHSSSPGIRIRTTDFPGFKTTTQHANMKGKSDFVSRPFTDEAFAELISNISEFSPGSVTAILDPYGGAIARVGDQATAFAHRQKTLFSIQYYSGGALSESRSRTARRLQAMKNLYAAMRPHAGPGAYVNYCDLDLNDWPTRYWGANLPRLKRIKTRYDPMNLFHTPQSVPPE